MRCFLKLIGQGIPDFSETFSFSFMYFEQGKKFSNHTAFRRCFAICFDFRAERQNANWSPEEATLLSCQLPPLRAEGSKKN